MKSIYERMAASPLTGAHQLTSGESPQRVFIVQFAYDNGLVVNYNGDKWIVVRPEAN